MCACACARCWTRSAPHRRVPSFDTTKLSTIFYNDTAHTRTRTHTDHWWTPSSRSSTHATTPPASTARLPQCPWSLLRLVRGPHAIATTSAPRARRPLATFQPLTHTSHHLEVVKLPRLRPGRDVHVYSLHRAPDVRTCHARAPMAPRHRPTDPRTCSPTRPLHITSR